MAILDETTPLLAEADAGRRSGADDDSQAHASEADLLGPDNPQAWPASFKWGIVVLLSFSSFSVTFGCLSVAPVASRIVSDLNGGAGTKSSAVLLVTIWELGEAAGPLLIAPLSELFGRAPLFHAANGLFVAATVLAALAPSTALFICARALTGMAVAANVLNPAVVGDMFSSAQRGAATSCIMFAPLVASSLGPAFSGAIAQGLGWRAVLWIGVGLGLACELAFVACFRETYKVPILRRRWRRAAGLAAGRPGARAGDKPADVAANADALRKYYSRGALDRSAKGLWTAMMRPAVVFFSSAVLAALSLYGSIIFSYFYVVSTTLPSILEDAYGFLPGTTGLAFLANGVGTFIGVVICNLYLDKIYSRLSNANKGVGQPEYRLPLTIIGVVTLPPAVSLYGWCAEYRLPLAVFITSVVWIRVSMTLAFLPLMPYVVDACGLYSASALTSVIVIRCLAGAFLPLSTAWMIARLGYGWGFTMLASISLTVGLIPAVILRYGARWRQRSKYTRDCAGLDVSPADGRLQRARDLEQGKRRR